MNICVIGTGYVGLVTGTVFADLGNDVYCVDKIQSKVDSLNNKVMPFYEPGLEEMVRRNMEDGRLFFSTDVHEAVGKCDVIFIAVGTPAKENGETDLSYVKDAAMDIAKALDRYKIIVNKSTVPVGTGDFVANIIEKHRRFNVKFHVVSNPEFLREGSAIQDALHPDRIVVGAPNKQVAMTLLELYATLGCPMIITDVPSAEIIKYASNSFLATKISFINSIADLCEKTGADVTMVAKGVGLDSRIGSKFLEAGLGYGGSCFPKDVDSLIQTTDHFGIDFKLLKAVVEINSKRAAHFVKRMEEVLEGLDGKTIGILGLAFKPNTDDMREAKSVEVIRLLLEKGANVRAYDPEATDNAKAILGDKIIYCSGAYDVAEGAHALALLTEWREFKSLNMERIRDLLKQPYIFDGRNYYDPERKKRTGFHYFGIGKI